MAVNIHSGGRCCCPGNTRRQTSILSLCACGMWIVLRQRQRKVSNSAMHRTMSPVSPSSSSKRCLIHSPHPLDSVLLLLLLLRTHTNRPAISASRSEGSTKKRWRPPAPPVRRPRARTLARPRHKSLDRRWRRERARFDCFECDTSIYRLVVQKDERVSARICPTNEECRP